MKVKRRFSTLIIVFTVFTLIAAACGTSTPENNNASNVSNSNNNATDKVDDSERPSVDIFYKVSLPYGTPSMEDNEALTYLEDQINADLNLEMYEQIYEDKIRVKIASGEIPDAFEWKNIDDFLIPLIEANAIVPFGPYIDDYEHLAAQKHLYTTQYKGEIYAISDVRNPIASADIPLIRQDWLDNLNLQVPTTTDELFDVAVAFTENDPNKNGKKDTYGIQVAGNNLDGTWSIKMAFGVKNIWMDKGGKIVPYFATEGYKNYLTYMQKLFKAGVIDPDFAVTDHILAQDKVVVEGKAGIFMHYAPRVYDFENGLQKVDPHAKLVGFEAVTGPSGDRGVRARVNAGGLFLSKAAADDPKKLEAIMKWLNFGASKEGLAFKELGVEGIHHTLNSDGTTKSNDDVYQKDSPISLVNTAPIQDTADVYIDPNASEANQDIVRQAHIMNEPHIVYDETMNIFSPTHVSVSTEANQFILDKEIQAIMGQIQVADWDAVVADWYKRFNGDQIVKEITEAM